MARSHPVDVHVGARMRQRRTLLGMSQEKLGTAVGLTFQQIQKYERGSNRIGSSRLFEFAKVLDVPVSYFFDEMPSNALAGRHLVEEIGHRHVEHLGERIRGHLVEEIGHRHVEMPSNALAGR